MTQIPISSKRERLSIEGVEVTAEIYGSIGTRYPVIWEQLAENRNDGQTSIRSHRDVNLTSTGGTPVDLRDYPAVALENFAACIAVSTLAN